MSEESDFKPRNYQVSLREIAINNDTIIYLPTGSGKTFIAILVLKHLTESITKCYSEGGKISFVVVNSVALVDQHARCIEKRTILKVGRYSGDMNLDFWPKMKWYEEFNKYNVFVMTVQILVNLTNQNFIDLNKVNLIVFDECHRAVEDQPMRQLCKSFQDLREQPRILGLTATLLNGNCKPHKVMENVRDLEVTFHSKVATVDGISDVSGYSTNPKEICIPVQDYIPSSIEMLAIKELAELQELLSNIKGLNPTVVTPIPGVKPLQKKEELKKLCNTIKDVIFHIELMGLFGGSKAVVAHIIQMERLKKHCGDAKLHMCFSSVGTTLGYIKKLFDKHMSNYSEEEKVYRFSSDKVLKLIHIFDNYETLSKEELCAIIFTKRRFTAKIIYYILDHLSKHSTKYSHIKTNFMVGYNNNPYNDTREVLYTSKKNREILQSFDNKEINVLVASNVLEEGVDITTCSLVIKFDYPEEYRSYIQSKGRARNPSSLYYMMVENESKKSFTEKYREFQQVESILQNFLVGQNDQRSEPSQSDIDRMYNEDELPPYYVDGPNSAKVDMVSAISLLCSYCSSLPSDKYTDLTPCLFYKEEIKNTTKRVQVVIQLPTISPLAESIMGPFMSNIKSAKRAAALQACILLHRMGELDDHLLPKKLQFVEEDVSYLFGHYPKEKEALAGTNKSVKQHKKEIPDFVRGPLIPNQEAYLHIISFEPQFEQREELFQTTFYDMYASDLCYGLITPHHVPTLCEFPIYVALGPLNVKLNVNVARITLSEKDIKDIREFNVIVLRDVLKSLREFLICDNGDDAETMLIVPVNKHLATVNFTILREQKQIKEAWIELSSEEKLRLNVTLETHLRKIVSPWYRDMGEYIVTEVSLSKSAKTSFPNESFTNYEDYYEQKHNVRLLNPKQPLLFVKSLTKKRNFIKPYGVGSKKRKEKNYDNMEIHLIPELVVKQEFPAELWIQAALLPTVISRFSFMFRLEVFRSKVAVETGMGQKTVLHREPLELNLHLINYEPDIKQPKQTNVLAPEHKEDIISPAVNGTNVNKNYAKKMLEMEYPWKDSEEPKDIERDLNVTILDIDYYVTFLSKRINVSETLLKNEIPKKHQQLALTYLKDYVEKPIKLLKNRNVKNGPELSAIYEAMTTLKSNDIVNMERLETLGDSFLKLFASIYIYLKFPKFTEGSATTLKGRLVSNKNLYYLGKIKNIGGIMKIGDLQISDWLPPGFKVPDLIEEEINSKRLSASSIYQFGFDTPTQVSGVLSQENVREIATVISEEDSNGEDLMNDIASFFKSNYVGDKRIADCVEALLGVYFKSSGILGGIKFMEWMNIIPASENLYNLMSRPSVNPILNDKYKLNDILYHIPRCQDIQNIIGYQFNNPAYLLQALTHSSFSPNRITRSYERLEFLGDAILDFLITCYIYETTDNLDPGELTDLRSALVNNNTFASLVVRCNLHKYLLCINNKLQVMIDQFAQYIESKNYEIDDEVLILLEESDSDGLNLAEYIDVPKLLSLKAEILRKQDDLIKAKSENAEKIKIIKKKTPLEFKNKGVDERKKFDYDDEDQDLLKLSRSKLESKAKLYEQLSSNGSSTEILNRKYLVRFDKKNVECATEKNVTITESEDEEKEILDNYDDETDPSEEWVEYVDCLGRSRKCLRKDLEYFKSKDEDLKSVVEKRNGLELAVENIEPTRDTEPANNANPENTVNESDEPELISADLRRDILRQRWEEEEEELKNRSDIHYQNVLFDEARQHGVGYYAFSKDEEERLKQQQSLKNLRKDTELKQQKAKELRLLREKQMAARIKAAKNRRRERLGLPPEEEETSSVAVPNQEINTDKEKEDKEEEKRIMEIRKKHVRPWDIGKEGLKQHYIMSQGEWNEKKRNERHSEFAPPEFFKCSNRKNKQHEYDCIDDDDDNENSDHIKSDGYTSKYSEVKSESKKTKVGSINPYKHQYSERKELDSSNTLENKRLKTAAGEYHISDTVAAGLKFLRAQVENDN